MIKRITYKDWPEEGDVKDMPVKTKDFKIKGYRNKGGLHIDKDSEIPSIIFGKSVYFLGRSFLEEKNMLDIHD